MGDIIGGLISGFGQEQAAEEQADAARDAAKMALTGYNYLATGPGAAPINNIIQGGQTAFNAQGTTQNAIAQLLGLAPVGTGPAPGTAPTTPATTTPAAAGTTTAGTGTDATPAASPTINAPNAFKQYLDSTGYNFALDQGMGAVTGNAATKGLLNSGATLKGLEKFGQGLGSQYFNNYLGQLLQLNGVQGARATAGQNALGQIATAGGAGGGGAANAIIQGGNASAAGTVGMFNALGNAVNGIGNQIFSGGGGNFFGGFNSGSNFDNPDADFGMF